MPSIHWLERLVGGRIIEGTADQQPITVCLRVGRELGGEGDEANVVGTISAPGLVEVATLVGRRMRVPGEPRTARYALVFVADDGRRLRLQLIRRFVPSAPFASLSTLNGEIVDDDGRSLARVRLRFDAQLLLSRLVAGVGFGS